MDGGYTRTYARYQLVGASGKGAARFFSHLDWDLDGQDEILLEILGDGTRWWAGLERDAEGWNVAFEDACRPEPPESPGDPGRS
jgi:hypothetical protein